MNNDRIAMQMLAMAEVLRTQSPPKLKMAMKCARGALKLNLSKETEAHCHLQMGKMLFFYTDHFEAARDHLKLAYDMLLIMGDFYLLRRLEALCLICELYIHSRRWCVTDIENLIRKEMPIAKTYPHFYFKLLFYFIEATYLVDDMGAALDACTVGLQMVDANNKQMELYLRITKALITFQLAREEPDPADLLRIGAMIKEMEHDPSMSFHLKNVKGFFMCTKLAFMISQGQSRTSRTLLRQIQQEVSSQKDQIAMPGMRWMDEKAMTVFACVMNVVGANVQGGYERALKYHNIAIKHADDVLNKSTNTPQEFGVVRCVSQMKMVSLEMMSLMNVMACRPNLALNNLQEMLYFSSKLGCSYVYEEYAPQIHYVLAMQSLYLNRTDIALTHLTEALKTFPQKIRNTDPIALLRINLGMTYLNQMNMGAYYDISEELSPAKIAKCSPMVQNCHKAMVSFFDFLNNRTGPSKQLAQDGLQAAKAEDFFRLHSLFMMMLTNLMPVDESIVKPTVDFSKRSSDHAFALWGHTVYKRILDNAGGDSSECAQEIQRSMESLNTDNLINLLRQSPAFNLLQWFNGSPFDYLPKEDTLLI
ncbi:unnamed protein product [Caenorhabditis angaria]|uniref:Cohesin loading complex subunit SCC4 homolog n=1 Tax=Caenorhabditis angaria TaxID=860376 RepID=A0A9P1I4E2_9PELO|nr:unnamed protein product [Caenorhabditis angaria]